MIIRFPAYRNYENAFIDSNDAIMALLVAAQLTGNFLEEHPDRTTLLPDLFKRVPEIKRMNRSPEDAANILAKSESYLANMAIVYVLAVQQSYMNDVVDFLRDYGYEVNAKNPKGEPATIDAENVYKAIEDCLGAELDADLLQQFYFVRRVRNRITHYGGDPGYKLRHERKDMTLSNQEEWENRMGRSLKELLSHNRIELTSKELMGTLSLSRRVVIKVHDLLVTQVKRDIWADVVVQDYAERNTVRFKNADRRLKHIQGYASSLYSGLDLTKDELESAIETHLSSVEETSI